MTSSADTHTATPRLERPHQGRMVAGVCAGIGRHLRIDPVLIRIAFVVAILLGGVGIAAYVAAWLLMPEEGRERSWVQSVEPGRAAVVLGVILVVAGAGAALHAADFGFARHVFWPLVLVGGGLYLISRARARREARAATAPGTPEAETAQTAVLGQRDEVTPRPRRATTVVAGVMLLAAGAVAAAAGAGADPGWQAATGIAVIAAGAVLIAGAFFGASPWLSLPVLLVAATVGTLGAADVRLNGPIGDRSYHPATARDLPETYRMAIGDLDVDLRDISLPTGTTRVEVRLGIGQATVRVPDDVAVRIDGHSGAGVVQLPGGRSDGSDVDRSQTLPAPGRPELVVDARLGLGELVVVREGDEE